MGTALVTGATSGLGEEFCWQLATAKHDLVLVARSEQELNTLAAKLRQIARVKVEVLPADLAEPEDLANVCVRAAAGHEDGVSPVDFLVNNAGLGNNVDFLDNDLDQELYGLDVMVRAVMATCYYAGRAMRSRGRGAILNVSSVAADTASGVYSAHKAWVRTFSEALASELSGTGVTVTALTPGLIKTDFHRRAGRDVSTVPEVAFCSPAEVVEEALQAVRSGRVLCTPTAKYKLINGATRFAPRSVVRYLARRLPH